MAHFSLFWAEGEVLMYRTYRKIQDLDQTKLLPEIQKMLQNFSLSESSRLTPASPKTGFLMTRFIQHPDTKYTTWRKQMRKQISLIMRKPAFGVMWRCNVLSQSYKATVFYFDNISFLAHVNQLFLPNESSISQASYRTLVLTICFQLFRKQTILWR